MDDSADTSAAVGAALRALRLRRHEEVDALARRAGVKTSVILDIEGGRSRASLDMLDRVASALGTSLLKVMTVRPPTTPRVQLDALLVPIAKTIVDLPGDAGDKLDRVEGAVVRLAMTIAGGNKSSAARLLGLDRKALVRKWSNHRNFQRQRAAGATSNGTERTGGRRSRDQIDRLVDRVVALAAKHPDGIRSELLREAVGVSHAEFMLPVAIALASKRLRKKGQKRKTTYFAR
jgi:transcriptional regulator with XRE-family HTH domain